MAKHDSNSPASCQGGQVEEGRGAVQRRAKKQTHSERIQRETTMKLAVDVQQAKGQTIGGRIYSN